MSKGVSFEISEFLNSFEVTDATIEKIERLEDYIREANTVANMKTGELLVVDAIYDEMMSLLREVKPESDLLNELWETEDENNIIGNQYTELLEKNPMKSILTVKSFDSREMAEYVNNFPDEETDLHLSLKINGWGVRIVYLDRQFVSATSRARSSAGRDLTKQLRVVLEKHNLLTLDDSYGDGLAEFRGELALPFSNLDRAREFNPTIVSAFSGVSSMARDSASDEEHALLDFLAYNVIMDDLEFTTKTEMYNMLSETGFMTPVNWTVDAVDKDEIVAVLEETLNEISDEVFYSEQPYEYFTDGVIVQVDSYSDYYAMGENGSKYDFGNIALKVGDWKQDNYYGYVQFIEYSKGKSKLSPVAIISTEPNQVIFNTGDDDYFQGLDEFMEFHDIEQGLDLMSLVDNYKELGVPTVSGNRVRRVPLYEPMNIIRLGIKPNSIIHFKYGGEAGVVPCYENGSLLSANSAKDYIDTIFE